MNLKEIQEMINLMNKHNLVEMELERDGLKLKLKKAGAEVQASPPPALSAAGAPAAEAKPHLLPTEAKGVTIDSPMVGTFYRAPSPETRPFVDIGEVIEPGGVVCIIEAMKLMNEIKAEFKGKIAEVLVENGQPVEFGQPLFRVEPS